MKTDAEKEIREWWNACPLKVQKSIKVFMVLLAFYLMYELGEGVGKFIYNILH